MDAPPDRRRGTVVFDGDCGFCTTSARAVERWFPDIAVIPWQTADLERLGVTAEQCSSAVQWIGVDGTRAAGAEAIGRLLISQGPGWAMVGLPALVPPTSWAARRMYSLVAEHRHRLPGGTPACAVAPG